jgi:hypothetical protein
VWIVISVVGGVLFLLVILLAIAVAAGAFGNRRSDAESSNGQSAVLCFDGPENPQILLTMAAPSETFEGPNLWNCIVNSSNKRHGASRRS